MQSADDFLAFVQTEAPRLHRDGPSTASSPERRHASLDGQPRIRRGSSDVSPPPEAASSNEVDMTMELVHMTLLEHPAWVNACDANQSSLLHWVAQRGAPSLLQLLLDHGAAIDAPDANGLWPVHWAAAANNLAVLRTLLQAERDLVNAPDTLKQRTPLLLAVQHGHVEAVVYLLRQGADASRTDHLGDSFVHWAAYKGALQVLRVGFAYADTLAVDTSLFHVADSCGQTPLHLAALRGHADVVAFLVDEVRVPMECDDEQGQTPLMLARSKGHTAAAAILQARLRRRHNVLRAARHALRAVFPRLVNRMPLLFQASNLLLVPCWYGGVFWRYEGLTTTMTWHSVLMAFTWYFFACAAWLDPGTATRDHDCVTRYAATMHRLLSPDVADNCSNVGSNDKPPVNETLRAFCHSCRVDKPPRAKHCNVCNRCVALFDHHCPFLGTCVGRNNYTFFVAFTGCMGVASLWLAWMWYTIWMRLDPGATTWCVLAAIYYTLFGGWAMGLLVFHLVLAAKNQTTFEFRHGGDKDHDHHDRGSWYQNCVRRLCVSVQHHYANARRPSQKLHDAKVMHRHLV